MKTTASQSCGVGPNKCLILGWTLYCFLCGVKLEPFILPLKSWRSAWSERGCSGGCVTWILLTHPVTNQEHSGVHIPVDPVSSQCCVVNSMLSLTPDCTADQTSRLLHLLRGEGRFIGSCNFHVRSLELFPVESKQIPSAGATFPNYIYQDAPKQKTQKLENNSLTSSVSVDETPWTTWDLLVMSLCAFFTAEVDPLLTEKCLCGHHSSGMLQFVIVEVGRRFVVYVFVDAEG